MNMRKIQKISFVVNLIILLPIVGALLLPNIGLFWIPAILALIIVLIIQSIYWLVFYIIVCINNSKKDSYLHSAENSLNKYITAISSIEIILGILLVLNYIW